MIGKDYFSRQAAILLKLAKITSNPTTVAAAATKAAEMKTRLDEAPAPAAGPPTTTGEVTKQ